MESKELTEKSRSILEMIAKGHTYEQILVQELAWRYHDIFDAASEALQIIEARPSGSLSEKTPSGKGAEESKSYSVEDIRQAYPQAYAKWTPADDNLLAQLFGQGTNVRELATALKRQPSAIRSRLAKLGLSS